MSSNKDKTPKSASGSLAHNPEDVNPFERRSRLSRSPVRTLSPAASNASEPKTPAPLQENPSCAETTAEVQSPFEAVISVARSEEEDLLKQCLATVKTMKAAATRQPNIKMEVKDGILSLETNLRHILTLRKSWQSCEKALVSSSTQTTPPKVFASAVPKRAASSPVEPEAGKKKKTEETTEEPRDESWADVVKKKKKKEKKNQPQVPKGEKPQSGGPAGGKPKKPKGPKKRPDALLIRPSQGKSYAEVLGEIRQKAKPDEKGAVIKGVRKTRAGDLLIELADSEGSQKSSFSDALQTILGADATVRVLEHQSTLEVRDMDELTTEEEVTSVVKSILGETAVFKTFVSKANSRGQKIAILTLGVRDAAKLLKEGHIKIGWMSCRVREKLVVSRCFKCLGFGHIANRCTGPDRSKLCFKCGSPDHKASVCSSSESCVLCAEAGLKDDLVKHAAGSNRCGAYKKALEKLRSSSRK